MDEKVYPETRVRAEVARESERLFAPWRVGRPEGWVPDERTRELVTLGIWLREQLIAHRVPDEDRRRTEWAFNRKSRAEDNLYGLVSILLTDALAGKIDRYRGR